MGFRFNKRIKLGKGLGLNISKRGLTPNYRTKRGSISTKGYSLRTGIPGLSYRKRFKGSGCLVIIVMISITISFMVASCTDDRCSFDTNCSDYSSQSLAQQAFDEDPECRRDLDRDNDGTACEELSN